MKRKFGLLSILSAAVIGASIGLSACGPDGVEDHDHVWNGGEVTTESTCHSEGVKTYTCTVDGCEQTKTEPVAMTAHSWDNGEVTTEPSCKKEGVKTYKCKADGCGKIKEDPIDKTAHRWNGGEVTKAPDFFTNGTKEYSCLDCGAEKTESIPARADFSGQFYASSTEQNNWLYGYVYTYNAQTVAADFVRINQTENGAWKAEKTEIAQGYVYSENYAVIAYRFPEEIPEGIEAEIAITFNGEESNTVLNAHLIITDKDGESKIAPAQLNGESKKDWSYNTEEAVDIAQGDTFWLVFENIGTGKAGGSLTFTLTAVCNHVWNSGTVKKPASCTGEGEKEYSCLSCGEKYTETIEIIPHEYDEGTVTLAPTEKSEGVMTYACLHCDDAKTEPIPRLVPTEFSGANLKDDFTLESNPNGGWSYGAVNYHFKDNDDDNEDFTFIAATEKNEYGWIYNKDDINVDVRGDFLIANKGFAAIAYTFGTGVKVKVSFKFTGNGLDKDEDTQFNIRIGIKDKNGVLYSAPEFRDGQVVEVNEEYEFKSGDTIYFIIEHKEGKGWDSGTPEITLTKAPEPEFSGANFAEDFELNESGEFAGWQVGVVDYRFDGIETFDFTKISALNDNQDAYHNGAPWIDIKDDWMAVNGMMGFAYRFTSAASVNVEFNLHGVSEDGKFSLRWAIKDKDGNIKNPDGKAQWGTEGHDIEFKQDITVAAGDVLYLLVNKDEGGDQNTFDITLTNKNRQPAPEFNGANFAEEFSTDDATIGAWGYHGIDYDWDADNLGSAFGIDKSADGSYWERKDGDNVVTEIKANEIKVEWMCGISYAVEDAMKLNVKLTLAGGEGVGIDVRITVIGSDGTARMEKADYFGMTVGESLKINETYDLQAGDKIYFIFSGKDAATHKSEMSLVLTQAEQENPNPAPEFSGANFAEDFELNANGTFSGWEVGYADYRFDGIETFDFTKISALNDNQDAYHNGDPWVDIKGDWLASKAMVGIAYNFEEAASVRFNFTVACKDDSECAVRWAVKDSSGNIKDGGKAKWGGSGNNVTVVEDITVEEGDVLYVLIGHENGDNDQKEFTLSIEKK